MRALPVATAAYIGIQLLVRYEAIHEGGSVHLESLPNHMAFDIDNHAERATFSLFDFGEALSGSESSHVRLTIAEPYRD